MVGGSPQETAIQNNIEGLISIVNAAAKITILRGQVGLVFQLPLASQFTVADPDST